MPKVKEKRLERGLEQAALATTIGVSAPMLSNFENYKCLPVPEMLKEICKALDCGVYELYDYPELYVDTRKLHREIKVVGRTEPSVYKLSVRLPDEAREKLTQANLEKCGYHSLKDFVWHSFQRFLKQLATITAKENRPEYKSDAAFGNSENSDTVNANTHQ